MNAATDDDLPRLVHDGIEDLDDLDRLNRDDLTIAVACPRCGAPVAVHAVAVALHGQPATLIGPGHLDDAVADHLVAWLGFEVLRLGDLAVLEGTDGLSPSIAPHRCPSCRIGLLAVASFGEVQPARWRLVLEGLVPADTGDRATGPPFGADPSGGVRRAAAPADRRSAGADSDSGGARRETAPDPSAGEGGDRNRLIVVVALAFPVTLVVWLHATAWLAWSQARSSSAGRESPLGVAGYDRASMVVFITVLADVLLVTATVVGIRSARRIRADQAATASSHSDVVTDQDRAPRIR